MLVMSFSQSIQILRSFTLVRVIVIMIMIIIMHRSLILASRVSFPDHRFTVSGMTLIGVNDIYGFAAKLTQLELNTIVPQGNTISMVIIDNITWPFRTMERSKFRTRVIRETGRRLKEQAKVKNIPIICINDLTFEYFDDEEKIGKMLIPSLGNTWNEYIDTRIMIVSDKRYYIFTHHIIVIISIIIVVVLIVVLIVFRVMYVAKSKMPFLYQEQYEITETRVNFQRI